MKAMIFAAGLGTRLKPFTDNAPKALAMVHSKTLLQRNIEYLQRYGIYDVIINVHHFADMVEQVLTANKNFGSRVCVSDERNELLETGGGLKKAAHFFSDGQAFVVMNVDVLTSLHLGKMIAAHRQNGAIATLAVMDRSSSRHFLFDDAKHLCGWRNNKTGEERIARQIANSRPLAFSGVQVLETGILQHMPVENKFSLVDLYLRVAASQNIIGYEHTGDTFIDVGKPGSMEEAERLFAP